MKRKIILLSVIMSVCFFLASCQKDLYHKYGSNDNVCVNIVWDKVAPDGASFMRLFAFPRSGSTYKYDFDNVNGGNLYLGVGSYKMLVVNPDDEIVDIIRFFEENIIFSSEANPTGIYKFCRTYAEEHGTTYYKTIKTKDEFGNLQDTKVFDRYELADPNEYRLIIIDTINIIDTERGMSLKQAMDKLSEYLAKYLRNRYFFSPIVIQQQAFEQEGNEAFKLNKVRPSVAGLGDSKYISRDKEFIYMCAQKYI